VNAEVPGIPKEQLKLQLNDGVLTISGERKEEKKEEKENYVRHECSYGQVSRSLRLPKNVDGKKVSAKYENGVLSVEVPKAEESKPMDVTIA
jgi:HSP20 family protein